MRRWLAEWLINRNYTLFLIGATVSGIGYWFLLVALGWLVLELSNSTFLLGLATFAMMAPMFVLGLFGGLAADRFDRRRLMLAMQLVTLVANGGLALLYSLGQLTIPAILLLSLLIGLANSVLWPTWSVFIKDLVGTERLRQAVALNGVRFNMTRVIGPALAGLVLRDLGPGWCLWVGFVSGIGIILTILLLRLPRWHAQPATQSALEAVGHGLRFVWTTPAVRRLMLLTGVLGLVVLPFQTFLPAVARDSLGAGPEALGLLTAAVGLGAMVGAIASSSRLVTARIGPALICLAAGMAGGLALLALARSLGPALLALALLGLSTIGFLSLVNVTVQLSVPEELVGRVMGLWVVLNAGTQPIGGLVEGAVAERWGLGVTFGLAALLCALTTAALLLTAGRSPAATGRPAKAP